MEDKLQFKLPSMKTTSNHSSMEGKRCHVDLCDLLEPDKCHWVWYLSTLGRSAMVHSIYKFSTFHVTSINKHILKGLQFGFNITQHSNKLLLLNVRGVVYAGIPTVGI